MQVLALEHRVNRPGLLLGRYGFTPVAHARRWLILLLANSIFLLLRTRRQFHVIHLGLKLAVLVFKSDGRLVNLLVLKLYLLLLHLLFLELLVSFDHVALSKLAKHLELVQKLALAVKELGLLLEHVSKPMDLILSISVLDLDGSLDGTLHLLFALDHDFFCVDHVS